MKKIFEREVSYKMKGLRLDKYLILSGIGLSRSQVSKLIKEGKALVNEMKVKPSYQVQPNDKIKVFYEVKEELKIEPEDIPLTIVYEDNEIIVIDKPPEIIVHPARGHNSGTLVNALLYHCRTLPESKNSKIRPGVIHRLDKDTTGLLVFAKTDFALSFLGKELEKRNFNREYYALVWGKLPFKNGVIEAPIGRDTIDRKKMAVTPINSKKAITSFLVVKEYPLVSLLKLKLLTGRTHQIRVHLDHYGHPVVGDPDYGTNYYQRFIKDENDYILAKEIMKRAKRQMLHAYLLGFIHPKTKKYIEFISDLPQDFREMLLFLENYES
ncbi:MAG: RluA family pseudouridine synthase [candidate division WOR-3 bacterium]|nr:RluA family pseudouridine synthase [candidate division WOR-3 bacterium]